MKTFFGIVLLCTISGTLGTTVTQCDTIALPEHVQINDCDGPVCVVYNGDQAVARITLQLDEDVAILSPQASFNLPNSTGWYEYPFLTDYNGCNNIEGGNCPLKAGETITYTVNTPIDDFPTLTVNLRIKVNSGPHDQIGSTLACFGFTVDVKNQSVV